MSDNPKIRIDVDKELSEQEIEKLIAFGEGLKTEFKLNLPEPIILARLIASFTNSQGGVILIGVKDDQTIIGLGEEDCKKFFNTVANAVNLIEPIKKNVGCGFNKYKNTFLGIIIVHKENEPVFIENNFFVRMGNSDLKLKQDESKSYLEIREPKLQKHRKVPEFVTLTINEAEIKQFMEFADEDTFCEILLIPFLRKIGFSSVQSKGHRDRTLEFGQDIKSFKCKLPTGHWLYFAAQVKTGDINYSPSKGKGKNIDTIITQLNMAFGCEMFDPETNMKVLPDHILFISSGYVNEGARKYIEDTLSRDKQRRILMLNRDFLVERFLELGLPKGCQIAIKKYLAAREE